MSHRSERFPTSTSTRSLVGRSTPKGRSAMPIHSILVDSASLVFALSISVAFADGPNLGTPIDPADVAAWDISVMPDGAGLPAGSGTPAQGERITRKNASPATTTTARTNSVFHHCSEAARSPTYRPG